MKALLTALVVAAPLYSATAFTISEEKGQKASDAITATIVDPKCDNIAHDTYYLWLGNGFSNDTAKEKARQAKDDCETELKADKVEKKSLGLQKL